MATTTTSWSPTFSGSPTGEPLLAKTIIEMLDRIGDELVAPPGSQAADADGSGRLITRRELLARVLWTRAILDADGTATKLIIEYLDGKPGETAGTGEAPAFTADDMALAEALLREGVGHE